MPTMNMLSDLRLALRAVLRTPGFTATAALTLALGVGATTTLVSALDALLFRPPAGVERPEQVIRAYFSHRNPQFGGWVNSRVSFPDFADVARAKSLRSVSAVYAASASLGRGAEAREVDLLGVSGDYFTMLGTRPLMGRLLTPEDDRPDAGAPALVLSERFWRSRFGSDPNVVGREVPVDNLVYTIVGVAPPGFDGGNYTAPDVWTALTPVSQALGGGEYRTDRGWYFIALLGRLVPGASTEQAAAEATALVRAGRSDSATANGFQEVLLGPVQEARGPDFSSSSQLVSWLTALSLIVLLIACANVANLLLTRGIARGRELAIRKALGAGQGRVARQLFFEGIWLSLIAGAGGLMLTAWGGPLLRRYLLPPTMAAEFSVDQRALAIALGASLLAAVLASLLPALRVVRGDLTPLLRDGARGASFRRSRLRTGLVVLQVGLSILLVAGAGLFLQSLRNALAVNIGYDRSHIIMVESDPTGAGFNGPATGQAFDAMVAVALRHPAVEAATLTNGEPFGWSRAPRLRLPGRDSLPRMSSGGPYIQEATADYFHVMGVSILRGRGFTDADRRAHPTVALIGATMAQRYFRDTNPLGQCLLLVESPTCTEVIGVVADGIRYSPQEEPQAMYYVPLPPANAETRHLTLFLRTRGLAAPSAAAIRSLLQTAAPDLPFVRARALAEVLEPRYQAWRLGSILTSLFAIMALGLAAVGVYSVLAYTVRGRHHELGIRSALGAQPQALLRLVLTDGLKPVLIGAGVGTIAAVAAGRAMGSLLYNVPATDPVTLIAAVLIVQLAALLAAFLPGVRATRVDPVQALRNE